MYNVPFTIYYLAGAVKACTMDIYYVRFSWRSNGMYNGPFTMYDLAGAVKALLKIKKWKLYIVHGNLL